MNTLIKYERKARYKSLRKLRRARDAASKAIKVKPSAWTLKRVERRFYADLNSSEKTLALLIYRKMPKNLRPSKPLIPRK
ncbi:hypothetical protein [Metasolibacillus meyeri]|uniref:hypothetical protein n=1 Tax=Metasolibacillus meyeri TaxID=1071052 RepID=UPI000D2F5FC6|nr:hypothetical protein [Metasolibacillus meyeri]